MNNVELATAIEVELSTVEMADESKGPRENRGKMAAATRATWETLISTLRGEQPTTVDLPYGYIEMNCLGHLWNTGCYAESFLAHYAKYTA